MIYGKMTPMPPIDPATPRSREDSTDGDACYAAWHSTTIGLYEWMSFHAGWRAAMNDVAKNRSKAELLGEQG